jgi:hypothetical protein
LRKVFQVGRLQPPAIPLLAGVIGEISDRKTVNLPEIDDQGQPIITPARKFRILSTY